jgi:hypothetical protein
LKDLFRWTAWDNANNRRREFFTEFLELGGISRVLKFLMIPTNMSNMEYVKLFAEFILGTTSGEQNGEDTLPKQWQRNLLKGVEYISCSLQMRNTLVEAIL